MLLARFALAGSLAILPTMAYAETFFIPVVSAPARPIPSQTFPFQNTEWGATQTVSNPTGTLLTFRYTAVFGGKFAQIISECGGSQSVPPNSSFGLGCVLPGAGGIGFVQMDLDPGLVPTGAINLLAFRNCCGTPNPVGVPLAYGPLPVYDSLFPTSSTVASAEIDALPIPVDSPIRDVNDPLARRVNVTLFNAGKEAATATISAIGTAAPPIVVTLQGEEVAQLSDVFPGTSYQVLVVTVSQPFLGYASSVITYSDPTRPPTIAVYPFRQLP